MPSAPAESVIAASTAAATILDITSSTKAAAMADNTPAAATAAAATPNGADATTKKTWSPSPEPRDQTADDNDSTGDTSPVTRSSPSTTAPLSPGRAALASSSGEAAVVVAGPTGSNQSSPSRSNNGDGDGEAAETAGLYLDSLGMLIESSVGKIDGSPGNKRVLGIGRLSKEEVAEADALAAAAIDTSATAISAEDEAAVAEVVAAAEAEVRSPTSGRGKGKGMGFNVPMSAASTTAAARRAADALPTAGDTSGAGPAVEVASAAVPERITVLTVEEAASESMPEMKARLLQNQASLDRQLARARAKLATRQLHVDLWRTQWLAGSAPGVQQLPDRPTAEAVSRAANELRVHAAGFLQQRKRTAGGRAVRHAARRMDRMVTRSLTAVDPDQTDWSSCQSSESESEMVDANGHPLPVAMSNPVSAVRRKRRKIQQRWDGERAEIGWRWAWLNLKLKALNEQLDGHEELQGKIREGKQPVDFGVIPAATSLFQVGDKVTLNETGEHCQVTAIDPALPGDYDTFLSIRFPSGDVREQRGSDIRVHGTPAPLAGDAAASAAADPGCARARPMKSGFAKRKLIRGHVNAPTVSHNAFRAVSAPLVHSDRNAIRARSALLDRSFHLVLSLPSDAPESVLSRARHHRKMVRSQDPRKKASFYGHSRSSSLAASRRGSGSSMAGMGSPRRTSIKSEPYSMEGIESPRHDGATPRITTKYVKVLRVESGDAGKLGTPTPRKSGEKDKGSLLSRRKKGSRDNDSIDNIMIPQILTPSRYEPLVVKEILTPSWNKSAATTPILTPASSGHFTGFSAVPEGDAAEPEPEVLTDAVFSLRHASAELAEKNRFIGLTGSMGGSMGGANKQKANVAAPGGGPDKAGSPKEAPVPMIRVLEIRAAAIPPHPGWTARPFPLDEQDNALVVAELPRIELVVPQYKEWKRAQEEARLAAEEPSDSEPEPEPEAPKPIRLIFKISAPAMD